MPFALPLPPETHTLRMDAAAWTGPLLVVEPEVYAAQRQRKQEILASDPAYYFVCPPEAEAAAWEALELLLPEAARHWPQFFQWEPSETRGTWTNALNGERTVFTPGDAETLPLPALDWLARQFQEDLVLMTPGPGEELLCTAGSLCFASGWCLGDKRGLPLAAIHAPVPEFAARAGLASTRLMERLKPGRPVGRWNWTFAPTDRLNLAPKIAGEWANAGRTVTSENAGRRCVLRTERQTLSRLPRTGAALFTIHTFLTPLAAFAGRADDCRRLRRHLESLSPAMRAYRSMDTYADALLDYFRQKEHAP